MPETFSLDAGLKFNPQQLQRAINTVVPQGGINVPINFKVNSNLPLGKITGQVKDFDRALDAATDRVVAFGAAAGAFTLISRAISELVTASTEVENALIRIGANFDKTDKEMAQFGKTLFDIARQTGSTFADAAKGAEELARQGLSIAETQKRLKDALILSRISGTDVDDTIQNLTATLNTFNEAGLDSTRIINKLVAVDVSAAVSAKDLQEAFARVGSSAKEAGVSFDQLLSLVTVVKERTGRDGAVIGNSLKTIFTRLERPKVLETLESIGVAVQDASGKALPAVQILTQLAKTYDTLGEKQKSLVTEQVAGGFQINIIKALIGDLSKDTTRYSEVLKITANAQDEATAKNEKFNTSLKSTLNATAQSITQIFSSIGADKGSGLLSGLLSNLNEFISKGLNSEKAEGAGKTWAERFISGISNVLTGPALVSASLILLKVFATVGVRVAQELAGYLNIGNALKTQAALQEQINVLLARGSDEERRAFYAASDIVKQKEIILALSERIAAVDLAIGGRSIQLTSSILKSGGKNFAGGYMSDAVGRETAAIRAGIGGANLSAQPVVLPNFNGKGPIVANTDEYIVPNRAGGSSSIFNKDMISKYGLPSGSVKVAAGGYVPNYASSFNNNLQDLANISPKGQLLSTGAIGANFGSILAKEVQAALKNTLKNLDLRSGVTDEIKSKIKDVIKTSLDISSQDLKSSKIRQSLNNVADQFLIKNDKSIQAIKRTQLLQDQISENDLRNRMATAQQNIIDEKAYQSGASQAAGTFSNNQIKTPQLNKEAQKIAQKALASAAKEAEQNASKYANEETFSNVKIFGNKTSGNKGETDEEYIARVKKDFGIDATGSRSADKFSSKKFSESIAIKNLTALNKGSESLQNGALFKDLPDNQQTLINQKIKEDEARRLYGRKASLSTLYGNSDSANEIEIAVQKRIDQLNGKIPKFANLQSVLKSNRNGNTNPFGISSFLGFNNPKKELEGLIASGKINPSDRENLQAQATKATQNSSQRRNNTLLGAAFIAPFASGLIDEGKGGTASGIVRGAAKGGLEFGGIGAIFGPYGALIGGAFGLLYGVVSKATKSLGEFQSENDKTNSVVRLNLETTSKATEILEQYKEALKQGKLGDAQILFKSLKDTSNSISSPELKKAFSSQDVDVIAKAIADESNKQTKKEINDSIIIGIKSKSFEKDESSRNQVINSIASSVDSKQITPSVLKTILRGSSISAEPEEILAARKILSSLNSEFDKVATGFGSDSDELFLFYQGLQRATKQTETFSESVTRSIGLLGATAQKNINASIGGVGNIQSQGIIQRLSVFTNAKQTINGLTNGPLGAIQSNSKDELSSLYIQKQSEFESVRSKYLEDYRIKSQENQGKISPIEEGKLASEYEDSLKNITVKYDELAKTLEIRTQTEISLNEIIRKRSVGEVGSYSGSPESAAAGIFSNFRTRQNQYQIGDIGKNSRLKSYLSALENLDKLGAKKEERIPQELSQGKPISKEDDAYTRRIAAQFKVNQGSAYGEASSFLKGVNPNGVYRDQYGNINKTAVNQALQYYSDKNSGRTDQQTKDIAFRYKSLTEEATYNANNPDKIPKLPSGGNSFSDFQSALSNFTTDQTSLLSQVEKLFETVKSTDIKILTTLQGNINIVSDSLSPQAMSLLSESIKAQILPIIENRIQQLKGEQKTGIPNPPSAKSYAQGYSISVTNNEF